MIGSVYCSSSGDPCSRLATVWAQRGRAAQALSSLQAPGESETNHPGAHYRGKESGDAAPIV